MANSISRVTLPDGVDYNIIANGIHYGQVDSTSTSTNFTATIPGITEYYDGLTIMLKNGVITSAANFTININGLGAKGSYSNMAAATRDTTLFNVNYTMLFMYDSTRVSGGCWVCYRGYNSDTNTIAYQVRTNSAALPVSLKTYRYRILFTSPDGTKFIPANTSTSTDATTAKAVNQEPINPFGRITYYSNTTAVNANAVPGNSYLYDQYNLSFGYSFNRTGAALTLTASKPVYLKCAPQSNGSAIIDADVPYVQDLPATEDGKIYIFLGFASSAAHVELHINHPVYYYKDGHVRPWVNAITASGGSTVSVTQELSSGTEIASIEVDGVSTSLYSPTPPSPSDATPQPTGTASAGSSSDYSRADHVHQKPTYTASDVGALPASTTIPSKTSDLTNDSGFITSASVPTKTSDLTNDSGFITTETDPTVPSWAKASSKPTYTASEVGALPDTTAIPSKTSDLTNDSGFITGMTILSYGSSTWQDFLDAYNANKVVYCRASSNSNPATGVQGRMAFMAFLSLSGSTPTSVEFQYYRSVSSHSDSQQGDQVYVYKLESNGTWSVTVRESYTKIAAGTGISKSYSNGTLTLSSSVSVPTASDATPQDLGTAAAGSSSDYSRADHVHKMPTASDVGALPSNTAIHNVPSGGSSGQVLKKNSATDYDLTWGDDGGGLYVVTATYNGSSWVSDKTYSQIKTALDGGSMPILRTRNPDSNTYPYLYYNFDADYTKSSDKIIRFVRISPDASATQTRLNYDTFEFTYSGNISKVIIPHYTIPKSGSTGNFLRKTSGNYDGVTEWATIHQIPSGGTAGQFLKKNSSTDGDAVWETIRQVPTGGSEGFVLTKTYSGYAWLGFDTPLIFNVYEDNGNWYTDYEPYSSHGMFLNHEWAASSCILSIADSNSGVLGNPVFTRFSQATVYDEYYEHDVLAYYSTFSLLYTEGSNLVIEEFTIPWNSTDYSPLNSSYQIEHKKTTVGGGTPASGVSF